VPERSDRKHVDLIGRVLVNDDLEHLFAELASR
jgi:hypothetical protein